jgi:hypothetical protein
MSRLFGSYCVSSAGLCIRALKKISSGCYWSSRGARRCGLCSKRKVDNGLCRRHIAIYTVQEQSVFLPFMVSLLPAGANRLTDLDKTLTMLTSLYRSAICN